MGAAMTTALRRVARRLPSGAFSTLLGNVAARVVALASVALGTLLVARAGGAAGVGIYALLRVLPGLAGVVISCGLPGAVAYFLAGPTRDDRRLAATIAAMALIAGAAGTLGWLAFVPLVGARLFEGLGTALVAFAGVAVLTQLIVATVKSCAQGTGDMRGANLVIVNEELMFLPAYGLLWTVGVSGHIALVGALVAADVLTFAWALARLRRRGFFHGAQGPSAALARRIAAYGLRAQVGGIMTLLNLRLDFILLSVLAGPAVLGVYAIASKFAELVKVPGMALTYVLYPRYSREGAARAAADVRRLLPRAGVPLAVAVVPLWLASAWLIPALYGTPFHRAVLPARIILAGLVLEGVAGVLTGFLYGIGRPGLNSWAMGAGLVVTVVLDLLLIPPFGSTGAAVASASAYLVSSLALVACFRMVQRPRAPRARARLPQADAG
jgi:O-antigen/teichoic acid export membrane protein